MKKTTTIMAAFSVLAVLSVTNSHYAQAEAVKAGSHVATPALGVAAKKAAPKMADPQKVDCNGFSEKELMENAKIPDFRKSNGSIYYNERLGGVDVGQQNVKAKRAALVNALDQTTKEERNKKAIDEFFKAQRAQIRKRCL
ncbi:MAG: hypothetical protein ACOYK8_04780 [Alphaproteobacteria bacterium]